MFVIDYTLSNHVCSHFIRQVSFAVGKIGLRRARIPFPLLKPVPTDITAEAKYAS